MVITEKEYLKINLPRIRYSITFLLSLFFWIISLFLIYRIFTFDLKIIIYFFLSFIFYLIFLTIIFFSDYLALILSLIFTIAGSFYLFLFYKFPNEFSVYISIIYGLLLLTSYFLVKNLERNNLKINWFHAFRILWNTNSFFVLLTLLIFLAIYFDFSQITEHQIITLVDRTKFIFEILNIGVTPDTKIEEIILRNVAFQLDEATKKEAINLSLSEINKRYNLDLKPESTLKEAIAQYLKNQTANIAEQKNKLNFNKIFIIIILLLILNSLLYILGYVFSIFSLIPFYVIKKIRLFEIEKEPTYKEKIKF